MEITSIKLKRTKGIGHVKAIGSVIIDNAICINDISLIETDTKKYISLPSRKTQYGTRDIVYPINKETRALLEKAFFEEFSKENNIQHNDINKM